MKGSYVASSSIFNTAAVVFFYPAVINHRRPDHPMPGQKNALHVTEVREHESSGSLSVTRGESFAGTGAKPKHNSNFG